MILSLDVRPSIHGDRVLAFLAGHADRIPSAYRAAQGILRTAAFLPQPTFNGISDVS